MSEVKGQPVAHAHGGDAAAVTGPSTTRDWELEMARKISASCWDFMG